MLETTLIVLCAGNSSRFNNKTKKQWLRINNEPLWLNVTNTLSSYAKFSNIIVTSHINEIDYMKKFSNDFVFVTGGDTRQKSISNALHKVTSKYVMITDVARACIPEHIILSLLENKTKADCIVPILDVSDTVIFDNNTIARDKVKLVQTPQLSLTSKLQEALETTTDFTDDSSAIKDIEGSVFYIKGDQKAKKLTFIDDLSDLNCLKSPSTDTFIGTGIDIHPFEDNKKMVLGGVSIASKFGFKAHSDGDVLIHSVIDSLLGAIGAGDIGEFFPDTSAQYKDADSSLLLQQIVDFCTNVGYEIVNVDCTIIAQIPKINPHKEKIRTQLSSLLNIPLYKVNIKATTAEKLGFIGREEAVAVQSSASLKFYDWKNK